MRNVIKRYVEVWNKNKTSDLEQLFNTEANYWDATQYGTALEVLGSSIAATHEGFPNINFEITSLVGEKANQFFLEWKMTGLNTGKFFGIEPTHKPIEIRGLDSITINDDKISEIKSFYDSSLFNQQLGI